MDTARNQEQGAERIAAALSATLKALSGLQESQKRIEDRQKEATYNMSQYDGRLGIIETKESDQYDIMAHNSKVLTGRLDSINAKLKSIKKKTSHLGKKPIRWKHHLRAGAIVAGALAFGLMVGWMWALGWLRIDETARMAMEKERALIKNEYQAMRNEKLAMDAEREIGHAVVVKVGYADDEQRSLILRLISSEAMSKKDRRKFKKWLESRSRKRRKGEYRLDLGTIFNSE
jgi:hypothetical protein